MFSKTYNHVTFFVDNHNENTDKVVYGKVSVAIKTGKKDAHGKDIFEYENWNARFVGAAKEKAAALTDKARITLTAWSALPNYSKEKKQFYPYLMVMDFEVREPNGDSQTNEGEFEEVKVDDDSPF